MLEFQNNNTTVLVTFEDFILTVYVIIDKLYYHFASKEVTGRRHVLDARLSDPEIITISICGELAGINSENAWYSFISQTADILCGQFPSCRLQIWKGTLLSFFPWV